MRLLFVLVCLSIGAFAVFKTADVMDHATNVVERNTENPCG